MRRLLMSTMICSGLLMAAGPARANAPQIFQPNTGWAVSKIEAKRSGAGEYCALARRFSSDMILTFARNGRDESSLAVDFQKDLLKASDTYFVTLKPGYGQDRMFEVKPVSGKAMVIRMGQDFAFFDALARGGKLTVDISGQPYEFNMPDIAQGQSELNGCLAGLVQPAAGDAPVIAPPSAVATPDRSIAADPVARDSRAEMLLQAPQSGRAAPVPVAAPAPVPVPVAAPAPVIASPDPGVLREVESLREENMRLKNAMERERRNFEERFQQQSGDSSKAVELNEKIRLLEMENESLRSNLTATANLPKPPPVTNEMMDKVKLLETENAGLRQTLADTAKMAAAPAAPLQCDTANATAAQGANAQLKAELTNLQAENARLKTQMADQTARIAALEEQASGAMIKAESAVRADQGAAMTEMQQRVAQLEEENAILRTKVKTQHVDAKPGEGVITLSQLRSVEAQMQVIKADRDRMAAQIENIQKGRGDDILAKAAGNWDLEEATKRFNEAEREIRRLGGQLEQERAKCAADVKKIEYMMFDPAIATQEQTAKLLQLEEQVMSFNARTEVDSAAYKSRIQTLEKTAAAKDEQLARVQQRIAEVEGKLATKDGEIRDSLKKIAALEQSLSTTSTGSVESQQKLAALEKSVATKTAELTAMQTNLSSLQQKYAMLQQDTVSKDSKLKMAEEKLAMAQQTVDTLQARGAQQVASAQALTEKQKSELAAAQAQLAQLSKQRDELAAVQAQVAALSGQKAELEQARAQIAALNAQKTELEQARAQVAAMAAAQKGEMEQQKMAAVTATSGKLEEARAQIAQLTAEKAALKAEAAKVAQLEAVRGMAESGKQEMAKLAEERAALLNRVASLEADKAGLEQALAGIQTAAGTPEPARAPMVAEAVAANAEIFPVPQAGHAQEQVVANAAQPVAAQRIIPRDTVTAEPLPPRGAPSFAQAAPVSAPAQRFAPAVAMATEGRKLMGPNDIGMILQQAGINAQGGIQTEKAEAQLVAYTWDTGTMYGSAEQQPMSGPAQFDTLVQAYLTKTGQRCGGEFGAIPGAVTEQGGARIASYEIACVTPDGGGASAAMVFMARDGLFTAIAHETGMDAMDMAMDVRDAVFAALNGARMASR
jgi:hypothetical protein